MDGFNLKQWLIKNKAGVYSKSKSHKDELQELDPAALGAGQEEADIEMQKKDDQNGDWVDNASMDTVAERDSLTKETVGWATITRPSDPNRREKLEI